MPSIIPIPRHLLPSKMQEDHSKEFGKAVGAFVGGMLGGAVSSTVSVVTSGVEAATMSIQPVRVKMKTALKANLKKAAKELARIRALPEPCELTARIEHKANLISQEEYVALLKKLGSAYRVSPSV